MLQRHGSIEGVLWDGNITKEDALYIKKAMAVVMPVETIPLEVPDALVPRAPKNPAAMAKLKKAYGLGGALDRLLAVLERQPEDSP